MKKIEQPNYSNKKIVRNDMVTKVGSSTYINSNVEILYPPSYSKGNRIRPFDDERPIVAQEVVFM